MKLPEPMLADLPDCMPSITAQLSGIAARLMDIAGHVASEAEAATAMIRGMVDQAGRVASLAETLETAAGDTEANVRRQTEGLAAARATLGANAPVIEALGRSIDGVASISGAIGRIAQESRTLSLNARIEASRAEGNGRSFAVVAAEMSNLTARMKNANDEIGNRAVAIARDVGAASEIVAAHGALVVQQDDLLATSLSSAERQRGTAAELATITADTVDMVDAAAAAIGRVGANAVAVKVLARQLARLTIHDG